MHQQNTKPLLRKIASSLALCSLLLSGCGTITSPDKVEPSTSQRIYKDALELDGRLSVQYQKNEQDEAIHASFTWKQSKDSSTITILSPLGQILATIDVKPGIATLTQSGQASGSAADVDTLAEQALGWPLPVSGLRNWLQGFATDANNKAFIAAATNTKVLTRDGWNIQYMSWEDDNQTPPQSRPKRIDLTRQTEQAGKVMIRIVLDKWQAQ
jgi:outer membrane lipoprotein LolB